MEKIGILTFHWGTNYGGVLQAWALQKVLKNIGADVAIINYAPKTFRDNFFLCFKSRRAKYIIDNLFDYRKELKFKPFRKNYLNLTNRIYQLEELKNCCNNFDTIICGSDQIWNPYIVDTYGKAYFLPFKGNYKKVAYAVSLGCTHYPPHILNKLNQYINNFDIVSVREKEAVNILNNIYTKGNITLMPDPTLLLTNNDLIELKSSHSMTNENIFFYTLQKNQTLVKSIYTYFQKKGEKIKNAHTTYTALNINEWINSIYSSKMVITNSYHGAIFSILFHKDFILLPIEGPLIGMNDRIYTLLDKFNLTHRILANYNKEKIEDLIVQKINWEKVEKIRNQERKEGNNFLKTILR